MNRGLALDMMFWHPLRGVCLFILLVLLAVADEPLSKAQITAKDKAIDKSELKLVKPDFDPTTVPVDPAARQKWLYSRLFVDKLQVGGIRQLSEMAVNQAKYFREQGFDAAIKGNDRMAKYGESMANWFEKQRVLLDKIVAAKDAQVNLDRDDSKTAEQKRQAKAATETQIRDMLANLRTICQNPPSRP